jgi:hypothetical protein
LNNKLKKRQEYGSSYKVPASQTQGPEFNPSTAKKKNPKRNKQKLQTGLSSTRVQYTSQKYVNLTTLYLKGNKQTTFKTRKTNARQLRNINNQNY